MIRVWMGSNDHNVSPVVKACHHVAHYRHNRGLEEAMKVLEQGMADNTEVVKRDVESLDRIFDKDVVEGSSDDRKV